MAGLLGGAKKMLFGNEGTPYDTYNLDRWTYQGKNQDYFNGLAQAAQGQGAPQANYANALADRQTQMMSRQSQQDAINQYKKLLADPNSSVAQQQLRAGNQQNVAAMMAAAHSGTPNAGGANMQNAMYQGMAAGAQTNSQAGILRAQETQAAVGGLAQAAAAQRAADLQLQGLSAQQAQYQAMLELQNQGQQNQYSLGLMGLGQQASLAGYQGLMGLEQTKAGQYLGAQGLQQQQSGAILNLAGTGIGALGAASSGSTQNNYYPPQPSDEHSKEKIQLLQDHNAQLQAELGRVGHVLSTGSMSPVVSYGVDTANALAPRGPMHHLPLPAAKSRVHDEATAAEYGARWLEDQRRSAMQDAAMVQDYKARVAAAQARVADRQRMSQQTGGVNENALYGTPLPNPQQFQPGGVTAPAPGMAPPGQQPIAAAPQPSDERSKQRIQDLEGLVGDYQRRLGGSTSYPSVRQPGSVGRMPDANEAVNALRPVSYEYKPDFQQYGQGRQVGVLAQDLQQTPAGAQAVVPGPQGMLAVDPGKASTLALAASSNQEHRLRELEDIYRKQIGEYDRLKGKR